MLGQNVIVSHKPSPFDLYCALALPQFQHYPGIGTLPGPGIVKLPEISQWEAIGLQSRSSKLDIVLQKEGAILSLDEKRGISIAKKPWFVRKSDITFSPCTAVMLDLARTRLLTESMRGSNDTRCATNRVL